MDSDEARGNICISLPTPRNLVAAVKCLMSLLINAGFEDKVDDDETGTLVTVGQLMVRGHLHKNVDMFWFCGGSKVEETRSYAC